MRIRRGRIGRIDALTPGPVTGIVVERLASRRRYMLQGMPGVGPALAHRLLLHFGSVERVVTADETALMTIPGIGQKKAARIRELVC